MDQESIVLHVCIHCGHKWPYRGNMKYIQCPKCHGYEKRAEAK